MSSDAGPSSWAAQKMVITYPEPSPSSAFFAGDPFAATPYSTPASAPQSTSPHQHAATGSYFPLQTPQKPHTKRAPATLLLESFPVPPTYIPASPGPNHQMLKGFTGAPNASFTLSTPTSASFGYTLDLRSPGEERNSHNFAPPSSPIGLPPSLPLPAVPGPSPISEHETMMFMAQGAASSGSRSRRASKMSTRSANSTRSSHEQRGTRRSSTFSDLGDRMSLDSHRPPSRLCASPNGGALGLSPAQSTSANPFGVPNSRRDSLLSVTDLHFSTGPSSTRGGSDHKSSRRTSVVSNRSLSGSSAPSSAYPRTPSLHEQQYVGHPNISEEMVDELGVLQGTEDAYGGMVTDEALYEKEEEDAEGDLTKVDITELGWSEDEEGDANEKVLDILPPSIARRQSDVRRESYFSSPRNSLVVPDVVPPSPSNPRTPSRTESFVSRLSQRMSLVANPPTRLLPASTEANEPDERELQPPMRALHSVVSKEDLLFTESDSQVNDSIASIDMDDLPGTDEDQGQGQDLIFPSTEAEDEAKAYADAQAFHLHIRAARSRSDSHKRLLQSKSRNASPRRAMDLSRPPPLPTPTPSPSTPQSKGQVHALHTTEEDLRRFEDEQRREAMYREMDAEEEARAASPDIKTILSTTPRPRRKSIGSSLSRRSSRSPVADPKNGFASGSRSSYTSDGARTTKRRASEGVQPHAPRPSDVSRAASSSSRRSSAATESARSIQDVLRRPRASAMSPPSSYAGDHLDEEDDYGVPVENSHLRAGLRTSYGSRSSYGSSTLSDDEAFGAFGGGAGGYVVTPEHENAYQQMVDKQLAAEMEEEEQERAFGGSDSDSSLDLHTPLPHLMMRLGLLNPKSKLLPKADGLRSPSPAGRPGSIMSVASATPSNMSKSGIMKDDRNTPMRRTRHRDGRLLRGGIGLTTGLGWSDSEDEDAPSALTRRISALNMTRRASSASLQQSTSSGSLAQYAEARPSSSSSDALQQLRSSLPPSAFGRQRSLHDLSRGGPPSSRKLARVSSESSTTLALSIPEEEQPLSSDPIPRRTPASYRDRGDSMASTRTSSSTTSTVSLPVPVTPEADDYTHPTITEKVLPPLPTLRKYPSNLGLRSSTSTSSIPSRTSYITPPQPRVTSSAPSVSSTGKGIQSSPSMPSLSSSIRTPSKYTPKSTPRPLQLGNGGVSATMEPPFSYGHDQPGFPSPSTPGSPAIPSKPKPISRTGTGMVYRKSGSHTPASSFGASPNASRMRIPSQSSMARLPT